MPFDPALRQIIASFKASPQWDAALDLRLVQALWPTLVGDALAETTTVVDVGRGRLLVRVPDPTWKRQLLSIQPWLLRKINEPFSHRWITEIAFTYEDKRN